MSLLQEIKRRGVMRVAMAYLAGSWLVLQVIETISPFVGFDEAAGRAVLIALAVGFFPTLIGAWVFEWTPEGLKLDADAGADADDAAASKRKLDRIILIVLTLAVGIFAVDKFLLDPVRDKAREDQVAELARSEAVKGFYGDRSIAVIPFINMSSDPEQEFLADGISEEILNLLANIRDLRVISRTSAFAFKGQGLGIRDIAERLDVAHVLEGSVRKFGDDIRVTAQLIEARSDTHLWSQTYDRKYGDVFALQDEIAAAVATQLHITLLRPLPKSRVTDPEVQILTAQAKQLFETRPKNVGARMRQLLLQALEIDPDYVPALEWMISANFFMRNEGGLTKDEEEEAWLELERRILALEPDNGIVSAINGWDAAYVEVDLELAARLFEDALRKDASDSNLVRMAGQFARYIGYQDQSIRLGEHSVAIDPMCYQCLYDLSRSYLYAGRYAEAEETRERYLALSNTGGQSHFILMKLLQGDAQAALEFIESLDKDDLLILAMKAMTYFDLGRTEDANRLFDELILAGPDRYLGIAEVAAWTKKNDLAFELLHKARDKLREEKNASYSFLDTVFLQSFAKLHDDPRWIEWRDSIGMSDERLAAINFNPELPE
jgi:TolB-like protein/tetratricopeptide (TPR) repeat protein